MRDEDRAAAEAAAVGPGVYELGGRTFVLKPLDGPAFMAIRAEWRRQCMASAADPIQVLNDRIAAAEKAGKPFSPTVVEALTRAALAASGRKEGKAEPSDAEIGAQGETLDGSRWLIWYRLRQADPTVTPAWVAEQIPDMEARNAAYHRLAELEGLRALDPKKA